MKLVVCKSNYADEFDTEGFAIWDDGEWDNFQSNEEYPNYVCIGTNEEINFNSAEEWKECFKAQDISDTEAERLKVLFGGPQFGMFLEWYPEDEGDDY